jgi:hypothetical protein
MSDANTKPEVTREIIQKVDDIMDAICCFKGIRHSDCETWNLSRTRDHVYGNHFTSDRQVDQLRQAIYFALQLLELLYRDVQPDYVPHEKYMRKPADMPTYTDKLEFVIAIQEVLSAVEQGDLVLQSGNGFDDLAIKRAKNLLAKIKKEGY